MKKINIALTGHTSVGKTTFLDTLLYDIDQAQTIGKIEDGKSLSDFDEEEIKRKISIKSSVFSMAYNNSIINIVDAPGSSDFVGEAYSSFYGVDSIILLVDAVSGVEIETGKVWNRAKKMDLPVLILVNKMDKENANFEAAIENIKSNLKTNVFPVQIPIGKEKDFKGVVDLIKMKSFMYEEKAKAGKELDIPQKLLDKARDLKNNLIETAAESTDELTEKYLEGGELTSEEIINGLQNVIIKNETVPIFFCSSLNNIGVKEAINLIVQLAPPSNYKEKIKLLDANDSSKEVEIQTNPDESFTGLVFKTVIDQFAGKITFLRVLSGNVHSEEDVINSSKNKKERLSKLQIPFGKSQKPLDRDAEEGDIVILTKLPYAETGDTLSYIKRPIIFPKISLPYPIHSMAIKAKNKKEEDKLSSLLHRAAEENISFKVEYNKETRQTVISGMGELQINIILSRIKEKYGINFETSTPLVAYRETIQKKSKADYKHKKQTGGHGQYGQVFLEVEPMKRGEGFEFLDKIVGGAIPKQYIPGVEKGVKEGMQKGIVAGYPVVDVRSLLVFGSYHDVDSSELAFKIAGRQAFKLAMEKAKPTLLEPIMNLNIYVNDNYTGDVMSDLNSKRGRVLGMDNLGGGIQLIKARVPQAELLKYSIELRSMTSGTGSFEMDFSNYEPISGKIAEDVVNETQKRREEEEK